MSIVFSNRPSPVQFQRKQERLPVLRNRLIQMSSVGRWHQGYWATGEVPDGGDLKDPATCGSSFCAAGWGAIEAGYSPIYLSSGDPTVYSLHTELYVPPGAVNVRRNGDFDTNVAVHPAEVSRKYFGLTESESWFLFSECAGVHDIDRFAYMMNIVKDGNPTDFMWLHEILEGGVPVPKAELEDVVGS